MVRSRDGLIARTAKVGSVLATACAIAAAPALAQGPDPAPPQSGPKPDPAPGASAPTPTPAPPPVIQAPPPVTHSSPPPVTRAPAPAAPVATPAPTATTPRPAATAAPARRVTSPAPRRQPPRVTHRHRAKPAPHPAPQIARVVTDPARTPALPEGLFRPLSHTTSTHTQSRDRLLVGSALAILAVAASTLLLLAQANRIRRELTPS
jgi:hypothetical protein